VWLASAAAIGITTAIALTRAPRPASAFEVDRLFAIASATAFLLSPLAWLYYDFLLVAPIVALAAAPAWRTRARLAALVFAALSLALTPGMLAAGQPSGAATVTLGSLYFWAVVALWLAAVVQRSPVP
jgi:hypothetical protein